MSRIWTKIYNDKKIIKDFVYEMDKPFDINHLSIYLIDICDALDVGCPILLKKHYQHLYLFNSTRFDITDFVHESGFDYMTIEII